MGLEEFINEVMRVMTQVLKWRYSPERLGGPGDPFELKVTPNEADTFYILFSKTPSIEKVRRLLP